MKIGLVENFGKDFVGARLRFAIFLKNKGFDVFAIIPADGNKKIIEAKGINVIEVGGNVRKKSVFSFFHYANSLRKIFKRESFELLHFYRLQPNIVGTLVAGLFSKSIIINHVTGLGTAFSSKSKKNIFLQKIIIFAYKINYNLFKPFTIFQNMEDIKELGFKKKSICIEGSAVDEKRFDFNFFNNLSSKDINKLKEDEGLISVNNESKVFIFVSRLLKEKGLLELVNGFKLALTEVNTDIKLLIVGWSDNENPSAIIPDQILRLIKDTPQIKFLGRRDDIPKLIAISDIGILPTYYREGTPRFLLENMAMKRAIITTDMPGCNHLIPNNKNGILIKPKNEKEIRDAIIEVLKKDLKSLGEESYKLYHTKFSEKIVYNKILNVYNKFL